MKHHTNQRKEQQKLYDADRAEYLEHHPFCMCYIARHELKESEVILANGHLRGHLIPRSCSIHHRNKRNGARYLDQRWWLAVCVRSHQWIEDNKSDARALGYLLPIQADPDGRWGDGNQGLPTPEFMAKKERPL